MPVPKSKIKAFTAGTHNRIDSEIIPPDAASDSLGWLTKDGRIELMFGRDVIGVDGATGQNNEEHAAFKTTGEEVRFRKVNDGTTGKVQALIADVWTDVITGLGTGDITFTNYSSLAGAFVYATSPVDGIFKIVVANPTSYADMYDSTRNFKGFSFIDKGRMIMWNTDKDSTGLYGSWIDGQDSAVYTSVAAEAIGASGSTNYTGTLAFKAGGSTRAAFAVTFTDGAETFTDNYDGTLTGDAGGTGTINYMTGAYDIDFNVAAVGAVTSDYQWEDSNQKGVTDFTKSASRIAGEGFVVRQDVGGDAIKTVLPHDGSYFSIKAHSVYRFELDALDLNPINEIIRTDIGIESLRGAVPTSRGIVFMDTGNPTEPTLTILQRNLNGDNFTTVELFPQFDFSKYGFEDVVMETWDEFVLIACVEGSGANNRVLMCNIKKNTVDVAPYGIRSFTKSNGMLHGGDPLSQTTYELFTGFDDVGIVVENHWHGADSNFGDDVLKRVKRLRFKGQIAPDQKLEVFYTTEGGDPALVGTILGSGDYVDASSSYAIGTTYIGQDVVGGGDEESVYPFLMEIKIKSGKFRKRRIDFSATGFGFVALEMMEDHDVWTYQDKLPTAHRLKQNVSVDGETTDLDCPEF